MLTTKRLVLLAGGLFLSLSLAACGGAESTEDEGLDSQAPMSEVEDELNQCRPNGYTTTSGGNCCSGLAAYVGSQLTCVCRPNGYATTSGGKCCSGRAAYVGSQLTCTCLPAGYATSSGSKCCSGSAAYVGSQLTCR